MDVVLVHWPLEVERRAALAVTKVPRLLLIEGSVLPPDPEDCLEDWVWVSAPADDVAARVAALAARAVTHVPTKPQLDPDGVLRLGADCVSLPPVEARLAAVLLASFGAVVSRHSLSIAGWPAGDPGRNALNVRMLRLRRRVALVALAIRTVRSRGYLLESRAPESLGLGPFS